LTTWHCILSAELRKMHSFRHVFLATNIRASIYLHQIARQSDVDSWLDRG